MDHAALQVDVLRGGHLESSHDVHAILLTADGRVRHLEGQPSAGGFWRSALKPLQALPVVEDGAADAFGYDARQLAVTCASHGGRPEHIEEVLRILAAIGRGPDDLHCGPHDPYDETAAIDVRCAGGPTAVHNNCSGKHASMIALALHRGWSPHGYWSFDHPVQRRTREILSEYIGRPSGGLDWAVDGCGVPTVGGTIFEMALAFARLGRNARRAGSAPGRVASAMTSHPMLTSSPGREPARIMEATSGRLLAKEGAEGVLCVCAPGEDWGMALKVEDGTRRAVGPAAVTALSRADLLHDGEREALADLYRPPILNTRGEKVGRLEVKGAGAL